MKINFQRPHALSGSIKYILKCNANGVNYWYCPVLTTTHRVMGAQPQQTSTRSDNPN